MDEDALMLIDKYLGDIIERIVYKFQYNVDLEEEYEQLLRYIYRRLAKAWFKSREISFEELEEALRKARKRKRHLEILLSYLISRYAARRGTVYLHSGRDWYDEQY